MPRGRPKGSGGGGVGVKPRGRMSAYAFFVQICREEHKKQHPEENVQFAEFSRQCADRWKTMSDKEKSRFHELAGKDKERYDSEMQDYTPPPGTGRRRRVRGMKKMKDPNKPKRALSAFFYYANDERPKVRALNPDFSVGEVAKELGRQWNEMTETEKSPFEKQAEDDRARYDREMQVYKSGESPVKKAKSNGHVAPPQNEEEELDDEDEEEEDEESD